MRITSFVTEFGWLVGSVCDSFPVTQQRYYQGAILYPEAIDK